MALLRSGELRRAGLASVAPKRAKDGGESGIRTHDPDHSE